MDGEGIGEASQADPLVRVDLFVALAALVLVVAVEHVAFDKLVERLVEVLLAQHVHAEADKVLEPLADVGALEGDNLVAQGAAQELREHGRERRALAVRLDFIAQAAQELLGVHLLDEADGLPVQAQRAQELLRAHRLLDRPAHRHKELHQQPHLAPLGREPPLGVSDADQALAYRRAHVELLQHGVDVARAPHVPQPHEGLRPHRRGVVGEVLRDALRHRHKRREGLQSQGVCGGGAGGKGEHELEGRAPRLLALDPRRAVVRVPQRAAEEERNQVRRVPGSLLRRHALEQGAHEPLGADEGGVFFGPGEGLVANRRGVAEHLAGSVRELGGRALVKARVLGEACQELEELLGGARVLPRGADELDKHPADSRDVQVLPDPKDGVRGVLSQELLLGEEHRLLEDALVERELLTAGSLRGCLSDDLVAHQHEQAKPEERLAAIDRGGERGQVEAQGDKVAKRVAGGGQHFQCRRRRLQLEDAAAGGAGAVPPDARLEQRGAAVCGKLLPERQTALLAQCRRGWRELLHLVGGSLLAPHVRREPREGAGRERREVLDEREGVVRVCRRPAQQLEEHIDGALLHCFDERARKREPAEEPFQGKERLLVFRVFVHRI